jgi:N-acetylneuraminate synthase
MPRTYVIAESGSTPEANLEYMFELIDVARDIGADAYKGQWLSSADRLAERRNAAEYRDAYRHLEYPREWLPLLRARCDTNKIDFMTTCYLPEDINVVAPHVARFKIASFEALDQHFILMHHEWQDKPMIISTGMITRDQWEGLRACWPRDLTLLHCVSAYPCPDEAAALATVRGLCWSGFRNLKGGYSDHTRHPLAGAVAVAAGASVVEFHLRHPACPPDNADHAVARTVEEAREFVGNIRAAETLLGEPRSGPMDVEAAMLRYQVPARGM